MPGVFLGAEISIHAPARGATVEYEYKHRKVKFQSTLPRGERHDACVKKLSVWLFQSTLPRGERHTLPIDVINHANFNPRSREGSDTLQ